MKIYLIKTDQWLRGLSPLSFIGVMSLALLLVVIVLSPILLLTPGEAPDDGLAGQNVVLVFILLILAAPIIETLIAQTLVITVCMKYLKLKAWIATLISSIVFAIGHHGDYKWMFVTFFMGLLLAYSFVIYRDKKTFSPTLLVIILHAIRNIPGFIAFVVGF